MERGSPGQGAEAASQGILHRTRIPVLALYEVNSARIHHYASIVVARREGTMPLTTQLPIITQHTLSRSISRRMSRERYTRWGAGITSQCRGVDFGSACRRPGQARLPMFTENRECGIFFWRVDGYGAWGGRSPGRRAAVVLEDAMSYMCDAAPEKMPVALSRALAKLALALGDMRQPAAEAVSLPTPSSSCRCGGGEGRATARGNGKKQRRANKPPVESATIVASAPHLVLGAERICH